MHGLQGSRQLYRTRTLVYLLVTCCPAGQTLVHDSNVHWAIAFKDLYHAHVLPDHSENVSVLLGKIVGVTLVYLYMGGTLHFFDIHFEECGLAAVNIRLRVLIHGSTLTRNTRRPMVSSIPSHAEGDVQGFWGLVKRGLMGMKQVHKQLSARAGTPKKAYPGRFCRELLPLFDDLGFKQWYILKGNAHDLDSLKAHIQNAITRVGGSRANCVGYSLFQHWRGDGVRYAGAPQDSVSMTLDPFTLQERYLNMFQVALQTGGMMVYTDVRMHFGCGLCSIHASWNVRPLALFDRDSHTVRDCNPLVFNHVCSRKARNDMTNLPPDAQVGSKSVIKIEDHVTPELYRKIFCGSLTAEPFSRKKADLDRAENVAAVKEKLHAVWREVHRLCEEQCEADNRLLDLGSEHLIKGGPAHQLVTPVIASHLHEQSSVCRRCRVLLLDSFVYAMGNDVGGVPPGDADRHGCICAWCAEGAIIRKEDVVMVPRRALQARAYVSGF